MAGLNNDQNRMTEQTWNPIVGCSKISPGCQNCYAEKMAWRLANIGLTGYRKVVKQVGTYNHLKNKSENMSPCWNGTTAFILSQLGNPLKRKKPTMYFVCSMGDIFHESVPFSWVTEVMWMIAQCRLIHTFQILTKRPERMKEYFGLPKTYYKQNRPDEWPLLNLWLGVTAENQEQADKRIPILLDIPAAVRFVSVEPMLEEVDIMQYLYSDYDKAAHDNQLITPVGGFKHRKLDWVIVGCESGHHRRPCQPDWMGSMVGQCSEAGIPVFVKQVALRKDKAGRDVTVLPGLWNDSDKFVVSKDTFEFPSYLKFREFPKRGER